MEPRTRRILGLAAILGGIGAVIVNVPSAWYGATPGDSFVFSPPMFTPLWIERTVVPVASVVAGVLLVGGLMGLVARDWQGMARLGRAGGATAITGLSIVAIAQIGVHATPGAGGVGTALLTLGAILAAFTGLLLVIIGLALLGIGYLRLDATRLGYALIGGPVGALLFVGGSFLLGLGTGGGFLSVVPLCLAFVVVGYDLWTEGPRASPATDPGRDSRE